MSWLNSSISSSILHIDNYYINNDLRIDRNDTSLGRGGGLLIYARNDVTISPVHNDNSFNQYCMFYIVHNGNCPLHITFVFGSPNSTAQNTMHLAELIKSSLKNSLIIGDFNLQKISYVECELDPKS